jgi:hypothetical protein
VILDIEGDGAAGVVGFSKPEGARLTLGASYGGGDVTQGVPGPGWYPDPWFTGQRRYWTGRTWTGDVFTDDPARAADVALKPEGERPPAPPPVTRSATPIDPPAWSYGQPVAAPHDAWGMPAATETLGSAIPPRRSWWQRRSHGQRSALALLGGLVLGFVVIAKVVGATGHDSAGDAQVVPFPPAGSAPSTGPSPAVPAPSSNDADAPSLQQLVVRQADVAPSSTVQLLTNGNQVAGETTLDLCNGTYPSESLRTARLQVLELVGLGTTALSTEAVLYRNPGAAAQAMREVQSVVAHCPDQPVVSPVGEDTVTTRFGPRPDRAWSAVPGVNRLAYSVTTIDQFGQSDEHLAVYLQRGRVLEGVYFPNPAGRQPAVDGQSTISGIVEVFAKRIAALPESVVNG